MSHKFGQHEASEVITQATTFLSQVESTSIWSSLSDPKRGRMTHAHVTRGRSLLDAAKGSRTVQANTAAGTAPETYKLDHAHDAADEWLADQLTHARGAFAEAEDEVSLAALHKAFSHRRGHEDVARDVRAYITLATGDDDLAKALTATYADAASRDQIMLDGEHLADAVEAHIGAPAAAIGTHTGATADKDSAVGDLSRWLTRWTGVARRVLSAADLHTLGLSSARHHPAHRSPPPPAAPAPAAGSAATS